VEAYHTAEGWAVKLAHRKVNEVFKARHRMQELFDGASASISIDVSMGHVFETEVGASLDAIAEIDMTATCGLPGFGIVAPSLGGTRRDSNVEAVGFGLSQRLKTTNNNTQSNSNVLTPVVGEGSESIDIMN